MATGELTGCLALTEPDAGSEATNIQTTARRDGEDYLLNGVKRYITNAPQAGVFTVMLPVSAAAVGVLTFVVPGLSWEWQFLLFGLLSIFTAIVRRERPSAPRTISTRRSRSAR